MTGRPLTEQEIRAWAEGGRIRPFAFQDLARDWLRQQEALERLASPDEMGGMGETEGMTGPAAVELRCRMNYACAALASSAEEEG